MKATTKPDWWRNQRTAEWTKDKNFWLEMWRAIKDIEQKIKQYYEEQRKRP